MITIIVKFVLIDFKTWNPFISWKKLISPITKKLLDLLLTKEIPSAVDITPSIPLAPLFEKILISLLNFPVNLLNERIGEEFPMNRCSFFVNLFKSDVITEISLLFVLDSASYFFIIIFSVFSISLIHLPSNFSYDIFLNKIF